MAKRVTPRLKRPRPAFFFRAWRDYRGLTQEQVAERIDMSVATVSQIESGAQGFTESSLIALAEAYQCEPADLLSRDPRIESQVVDMMALIKRKDPQTVMAILSGLPDKTGTQG